MVVVVMAIVVAVVVVSVSAQDGIIMVRKAPMRSAPSLSSLPKVSLEAVAERERE